MVPSFTNLKGLKVLVGVVMVLAIILSEKVAFTLAEGATPVAPFWGSVLFTLGGVLSMIMVLL